MLLYKELGKVLKVLNEAQIPVLVIKGAALAQMVYDNIGLRPMEDIDILIHRDDLWKIKEELLKIGYVLTPTGEWTFAKEGTQAAIDVHTDIFYVKDDELWKNAQTIEIEGQKALVMSPEDSLIYVAAHSSVHHGTVSKVWMKDIVYIIKRYREELDWNIVVIKIMRYGLQIPLYCMFAVIQKHTNCIPRFVFKDLEPKGLGFFKQKLFQKILSRHSVDDIGHILYPLVIKGFMVKVKYLINFLFPPVEFLYRRYNIKNPKTARLYVLLRPFLLIYKLITLLFKLVSVKR